MNKFKIFKKLYINNTLIGKRVSKEELSYSFDKEFINEAIEKLFVECPTKFPGEYKTHKHYLLKKSWSILNELSTIITLCSHHPLEIPKYIWWFIRYISNINADWNFYMHPTQINRYGK